MCHPQVTPAAGNGVPPLTPNGTASRRPLGRDAAPSQTLPGRAGRPYTSTGGGMNQRVLNSVSAPYFRRKLTLDVTPNLPPPVEKQRRISALSIFAVQ